VADEAVLKNEQKEKNSKKTRKPFIIRGQGMRKVPASIPSGNVIER
jgi:hypothetical protein